MAVESGKTGKIVIGSSDVTDIKNWKFDRSSNVKTYASSSTAGYQKAVAANKSGTVSFEAVIDQSTSINSILNVGDLVTLKLYRNASKYWTVPCRIESMSDDVNIEEGEPPTVSVEASTHGTWTKPS
jgi:exosome complex RNA-binding protein Rrp4